LEAETPLNFDSAPYGFEAVSTKQAIDPTSSIAKLIQAHKRNLSEEAVPESQSDEFYPSESQINKTINELDQIIKECPDEATKKRLEDVYARIYHSVYAIIPSTEDVIPYAVLLDKRRAEFEKRKKILEAKEKKLKATLTRVLNDL
jgi:hypothetical protein